MALIKCKTVMVAIKRWKKLLQEFSSGGDLFQNIEITFSAGKKKIKQSIEGKAGLRNGDRNKCLCRQRECAVRGGKWDSECLGHLTSNNKTAFVRGLFDHPNLSLRFRETGDWVVRH